METVLSPALLFLGIVACTAILAIAADWRIAVLALLTQYLVVGVLLARFVALQVAAVNIIVGAVVCAILYVAARAAEHHPGGEGFITDSARRALVWPPTVNDLLFRAAAVAAGARSTAPSIATRTSRSGCRMPRRAGGASRSPTRASRSGTTTTALRSC